MRYEDANDRPRRSREVKAALGALVKRETDCWGQVIKARGIRVD